MIDCLMLIAQMHEKGVLQPTPTQNVQMMRSEPREGDPNVSMVLRSDANTGEDKEKQPGDDVWVCKTPTKVSELDSGRAKKINIQGASRRSLLQVVGIYQRWI